MRLNGFFTPKAMMQIGVCGALVTGTYLVSHERPKDTARLLNVQEEGPFALGTKGDRLTVVAKASSATDEAASADAGPTRLAALSPAASATPAAAPKPAATAAATAAAPKPATSPATSPAASPAPSPAASTTTSSPPAPRAAAAPASGEPSAPRRVTVIAPPAVGQDMARPPSEQAPAVRPGPPAGWSAEGYPPSTPPVAVAPPPPKPQEQETLFGLPPLPSAQQVFDDTVRETNAAFGKMKQAMQDAFSTD